MSKTASLSHEKYSDPYRILALRVIVIAAQDALGHAGVGPEVEREAQQFFIDGRYHRWMELLGLDPGMLPEGITKTLITRWKYYVPR